MFGVGRPTAIALAWRLSDWFAKTDFAADLRMLSTRHHSSGLVVV
jgi:hypothetical protein